MMPSPQGIFMSLGLMLTVAGVMMVLCVGPAFGPVFWLGLFVSLGGLGLVVTGFCVARKNLQEAVPGHFLLHPRTGTRYSPHQALAIQRRLDRIRREMSEESRPPEPPAPSTPPPWDIEPPPSYDAVMKSQDHAPPPPDQSSLPGGR